MTIPALVLSATRLLDEVGIYVYVNGGVLGVILSWILPVLSYKNICQLRHITNFDKYFMIVAQFLGIIVVVITILFLLFEHSQIISML